MKRLFLFLAFVLQSFAFVHATVYVVTNSDSTGLGSFHAALDSANGHPGFDEIHFNIPGNGPHRILFPMAQWVYSEITDGVRIDGTTQPGYTLTQPAIVLDGYPYAQLDLESSQVEITGLHFDRFSNYCFQAIPWFQNPQINDFYFHHNLVTRSGPALYFGGGYLQNNNFRITDNFFQRTSGMVVFSLGSTGGAYMEMDTVIIARNECIIDSGYFQGIIFRSEGTGYDTANAGHVIIEDNTMQVLAGVQGFWGMEIGLHGTGGHNGSFRDFWIRRNTIVGHDSIAYIGISAAVGGQAGASNDAQYMHIDSNIVSHCNGAISIGNGGSCSFTAVMSHVSIVGNVLTNNLYAGISVGGEGTGGSARVDSIVVQGNEISGSVDGVSLGFWLAYGGLTGTGLFNEIDISQNHIHDNLHSGILVNDWDSSFFHLVPGVYGIHWAQNSIHDNGWLGIAIDDPLTPSPIECLLPTPTLVQGGLSTDLFVEGYMTGAAPNTSYRIEYYLNSMPDSSGMGEGETYLGSDTILLDGNGNGQIAWHGPVQNLGLYVSATATNLSTHNSGCFSNAIETLPLEVAEMGPGKLLLFPNPVLGNRLHFAVAGEVTAIQLVAGDGRIVPIAGWKMQGAMGEISLPPLASGVYSVVMHLKDGVVARRIVVGR